MINNLPVFCAKRSVSQLIQEPDVLAGPKSGAFREVASYSLAEMDWPYSGTVTAADSRRAMAAIWWSIPLKMQ
jgi:hypothetical protein